MKTNWKMYVSLALYIVLGVAAGYLIAKGVKTFMSDDTMKTDTVVVEEKKNVTSFVGEVAHQHEGEQKASVNFDHDSSYTVTQGTGDKSKYFTVNNASGTKLATIYVSYEGARGFSAVDYLAEVIAKAVPGVSSPTNVTYGNASWMKADLSATTEMHLAPQKEGMWLFVVESKKSDNALVSEMLKTLTIK